MAERLTLGFPDAVVANAAMDQHDRLARARFYVFE
jgi:hypothetical protein